MNDYSILATMIKELGKEKGTDQFRIHFENLLTKKLSGYARSYKFNSVGNIIHWLYVYGTLEVAESVQIGAKSIVYHGTTIATYENDEELQMPIFTFIDKFNWLAQNQEVFLYGLKHPSLITDILEKFKKYEHV